MLPQRVRWTRGAPRSEPEQTTAARAWNWSRLGFQCARRSAGEMPGTTPSTVRWAQRGPGDDPEGLLDPLCLYIYIYIFILKCTRTRAHISTHIEIYIYIPSLISTVHVFIDGDPSGHLRTRIFLDTSTYIYIFLCICFCICLLSMSKQKFSSEIVDGWNPILSGRPPIPQTGGGRKLCHSSDVEG